MSKYFNEHQINFAKWLREQDGDENSPLYEIIPVAHGHMALWYIADKPNEHQGLVENFPNEIEDLNKAIEDNYDIILKEWKKELDID